MLYERWRQIAREHRHETALRVLATDQRWTFEQLAAASENDSSSDPVLFPQGRQFIFTLLRAWRSGKPVCPLEPEQTPPTFRELPSGCAHFKTTSATAGEARVIAFTDAQLAADADNIVATMGLRADWPNLGVISLAHSYGFSNLVLPLLLHGIPLILAEGPLPEGMRRAAKVSEPVTLPAVPALWRAWNDSEAIPGTVRLAISAGAPLSLALEESVFAARGLKIHNFYGSSECGGIAFDASPIPRAAANCVGTPMRTVHVSVGGDGCLQVRGRAVGRTYWPLPADNLKDGCFRTSDLAEIENGLVYILGRAGDQINVAGRKASPEMIEKTLLAFPGVGECLVFGVPSGDPERGETIVACICAAESVDGESLKQFLMEKLPAWQVPREWRFVTAMKANERGKFSRTDWRRRFLEGKV